MKTSYNILGSLLLVCVLALTAQAQDRRSFNLDSFDALSISVPAEVEVRLGNTQEVVIETSEKMFERLEVEVDGNELEIGTEGKWSWNSRKDPIKIWITARQLNDISMAGSGKIRSTNTIKAERMDLSLAGSGDIILDIEVKDLELSIAGSGDMELSGVADKVDLSIAGSGDVDARSLKAKSCDVSISGSGDCHVNVADELDASIVGSGSVIYSGSPKSISTSSMGSGKVKKAS